MLSGNPNSHRGYQHQELGESLDDCHQRITSLVTGNPMTTLIPMLSHDFSGIANGFNNLIGFSSSGFSSTGFSSDGFAICLNIVRYVPNNP